MTSEEKKNQVNKEIGVLKLSNAANISATAIKNVLHFRHFFIGTPMFDAIIQVQEAVTELQNLCEEQEKKLAVVSIIDFEGDQ